MATGVPSYPALLDTDATFGPTSGIVAGTTPLAAVGAGQGDQLGITKNLISGLIAIETRVGVNNSAVTTTLDFRTRKLPFKTWLAAKDANAGTVTVRTSPPLLAFPAGVTTTALFFGIIPFGAVLTSGVIVRLNWIAATAVSGNVFWSLSIERLNTVQDVDSFDTAVPSTVAPNATNGAGILTPVTITTIDGVLVGEGFALRVQRLSTAGMLGDAQLQMLSIESAA